MQRQRINTALMFLLALTILFPIYSSAQAQQMPEQEQYIRQLVGSHPNTELRTVLGNWLRQGTVKIFVDPKVQFLAANLGHYQDKPQTKFPVIAVNPEYSYITDVKRDSDILVKRYLQIYHEYIHIKNHFSGKFPLGGNDEGRTVSQQAKFYWDAEWDASVQHWALARTLRAMHVLNQGTPKQGFSNESLWLLQGFYEGLLGVYPADKVKVYKPFWEKFYQQRKQEFAKLR